jgi:cytochrome c-type biogenesis protein CcmH/NrfG
MNLRAVGFANITAFERRLYYSLDFPKNIAINYRAPSQCSTDKMISPDPTRLCDRLISQAIQLNPQFVQAYMNLGSAKAYTGDLNAAIANFNEAVRLAPTWCLAVVAELGVARALVRQRLSRP